MQYLCPRSHYDLVSEIHPHFVQQTAVAFSRLPERPYAYSQLDIDSESFEGLALSEMSNVAKTIMKDTPGYRPEMTNDEIMSRLDPETADLLMGALHLEHLCIGNFDRFGKRTFFFGRELTSVLADVEPDVSVERIRLQAPCVMFVFDSQQMRNALYAILGETAPVDGAVSVYLMDYRLDENRFLSATAFHTDKRGIHGQVQRIIPLRVGSSVTQALKSGLAEDPGFPFTGSATAPKALLARIVANAVVYLTSKDADITPGLHKPGSNVSAKELRRIQRSTTTLEYSHAGGWLTPGSRHTGVWVTDEEDNPTLALS
ncbi:hypothetical protein O9X98_08405 [Agrobacterium salinitolerans]|nr:hypothetical protein [Agrobacterium salinitolerans]